MRRICLLCSLIFLSGPRAATSFSYDSQLAAELARSHVSSYQRQIEQPTLPGVEINDPLVIRGFDGRRMLVFVFFSAASQKDLITVDPDVARTIGRGCLSARFEC